MAKREIKYKGLWSPRYLAEHILFPNPKSIDVAITLLTSWAHDIVDENCATNSIAFMKWIKSAGFETNELDRYFHAEFPNAASPHWNQLYTEEELYAMFVIEMVKGLHIQKDIQKDVAKVVNNIRKCYCHRNNIQERRDCPHYNYDNECNLTYSE